MRASIYKRTVQRGPRKGKPERRWTIAFELASGKVKRERAYADKQASEQLLAKRQREVAHGIEGLADRHGAHKRREIGEHVAEFSKAQAGDGVSAEHVRRTATMLTKAFAAMGAATLGEIQIDKALSFVAGLVATTGCRLNTRNRYASALHAFGAWLEERDRLPKNPFHNVRQVKVTDGDRERSRVLTLPELQRLCAAAPAHRRLLYWFTAFTGFRRGEDRATTWADVHIDGGRRFVAIRGEHEKTGDDVDVPLPAWLAELLRKHRAEATLRAGGKLDAAAPVFHVPAAIVKQMRQDAARAGLGAIRKRLHTTDAGNRWSSVDWVDQSGRTLTFHSLRAFFATMLFEAGTPLSDVKAMCRHDSIRTTDRHYRVWRQSRAVAAIDNLPNPLASPPVGVDGVPNLSAPVRSWPDDLPSEEPQADAL